MINHASVSDTVTSHIYRLYIFITYILISVTVIERLKLLKLPTVAYRRLTGDMIEVYKIMHELYDNESAPNLLKWEDVTLRSGNRGHSLKIFTQRAKINLRKNAFPTLRLCNTS